MEDGQRKTVRVGVGAVSLFGVCALLMGVASQAISVEDPNAPTVLVYEEPIDAGADAVAPLAKLVGGADGRVAVEVFGVSTTRDGSDTTGGAAFDGVMLGSWAADRQTSPGRFVLSQTVDGVWLTVIGADGLGDRSPLRELPYSTGRFFAFTGDAQGDYLVLSDDGSLSLGDAGGVFATLEPSS